MIKIQILQTGSCEKKVFWHYIYHILFTLKFWTSNREKYKILRENIWLV